MTRFERFSGFICENIIYPLVVAFIFTLIPLGALFIWHTELMWAVITAFIIYAILGVWLIMLVICLTANKIIDFRENRFYKKCQTCDHYDDDTNSCLTCTKCSNYQKILIEKDESEE